MEQKGFLRSGFEAKSQGGLVSSQVGLTDVERLFVRLGQR